jgi:hypothetical protein
LAPCLFCMPSCKADSKHACMRVSSTLNAKMHDNTEASLKWKTWKRRVEATDRRTRYPKNHRSASIKGTHKVGMLERRTHIKM